MKIVFSCHLHNILHMQSFTAGCSTGHLDFTASLLPVSFTSYTAFYSSHKYGNLFQLKKSSCGVTVSFRGIT